MTFHRHWANICGATEEVIFYITAAETLQTNEAINIQKRMLMYEGRPSWRAASLFDLGFWKMSTENNELWASGAVDVSGASWEGFFFFWHWEQTVDDLKQEEKWSWDASSSTFI